MERFSFSGINNVRTRGLRCKSPGATPPRTVAHKEGSPTPQRPQNWRGLCRYTLREEAVCVKEHLSEDFAFRRENLNLYVGWKEWKRDQVSEQTCRVKIVLLFGG